MRFNTIPLVNLKLATVTRLGIIFFSGQVMHIPYSKMYKCHAFDHPVIIPEGELVCPSKFITPMIKTSYWYHDPNEAILVIVKFKKCVMPIIELIHYKNTTNHFPSRFKGCDFMNYHLLSEHDHQIILDKIEAR